MNRRARRRSGLVLAAAALSAAVWALRPLERRAASAAFADGVAAARDGDAEAASAAFTACLAARPGRPDCEAGLALARRALLAEESARRAAELARLRAQTAALAEARAAADPPGDPVVAAGDPSEEDKRRAIKHWNEGIKAFQQNNVSEAKDHWTLCKRFDAGNPDCAAGLDRLARTYGGGL